MLVDFYRIKSVYSTQHMALVSEVDKNKSDIFKLTQDLEKLIRQRTDAETRKN